MINFEDTNNTASKATKKKISEQKAQIDAEFASETTIQPTKQTDAQKEDQKSWFAGE